MTGGSNLHFGIKTTQYSPYEDILRVWQEAEEFQHKSQILDQYCVEIGRDPASLARSVQIIIDPREKAETTRQLVQDFITAGATHLVLAPRILDHGVAHWLSESIIEPLREAV